MEGNLRRRKSCQQAFLCLRMKKRNGRRSRKAWINPYAGMREGWKRHSSFSPMKQKRNFPHNIHKIINIMLQKIGSENEVIHSRKKP